MSIFLGVNIDHIATLRQARKTRYPSPVEAALMAETAGADSITLHLREDRRHIQDADVAILRQVLKTKMNLTTTVNNGKDAEGMFIQDSVAIADMPAMLALGIDVKPSDRFLISGSFNYYFDKKVDYDGQSDVNINKIDKNFIEAALGIQVGLTEKLFVSAGWLTTITGVNANYQSDLKYSLNTNTFGGGFGFKVNDMFDINLGGSYTIYEEGSKTFNGGAGQATNIFNKNTWVAAIGLDFHF